MRLEILYKLVFILEFCIISELLHCPRAKLVVERRYANYSPIPNPLLLFCVILYKKKNIIDFEDEQMIIIGK